MSQDFSRHSCPIAVSPVRCDECGGLVETGEVYLRIIGQFDGYDYDVPMHMDCGQARKRLNTDADLWGEEQMSIEEHLEADVESTSEVLRSDFPAVALRFADKLAEVN